MYAYCSIYSSTVFHMILCVTLNNNNRFSHSVIHTTVTVEDQVKDKRNTDEQNSCDKKMTTYAEIVTASKKKESQRKTTENTDNTCS